MHERIGRLGLAWVLVAGLAACGGAKPSGPSTSGSSTIGPAGGSITEASGATVTIPPGALATDTTYRIARDSTGAPPLPPGLEAAGSYYVVTPHGGDLSEPARVRIPAPAQPLAPNQELKLAKAQPGGPWTLQETATDAGFLVSQVRSFSYFVAVVVNYPQALKLAPAIAATTTVTCNGAPCTSALVGSQQLVFTVAGNDGQLPASCDQPLRVRVQGGSPYAATTEKLLRGLIPVDFQVAAFQPSDSSLVQRWDTELICGNGTGQHLGTTMLAWASSDVANVRYTTVTTCNGLPCPPTLEGPQNIQIRFTGNGGILPSRCSLGGGMFVILVSSMISDWITDDTRWTSGLQEFGLDLQVAPHMDAAQSPWLTTQDWHGRHEIPGRSLYLRGAIFCGVDRVLFAPGETLNWLIPYPDAPLFVTQPRSVLVVSGETANLSAVLFAVGPTAALQWQRRGAGAASWTDVTAGAGGATLQYTTPVLTLADSGTEFRLRARNAQGTTFSQPATVSVSEVPVAPLITTQPTDLAVVAGSEARFAVVARGTEALGYQWFRDGASIKGANAPVLTLQVTAHDDQSSFSVVVSNPAGQVGSEPARLTVTSGLPPVPPTITTQPTSISVGEGGDATFAVGVSGSGPLAFQWSKDGVLIAGATAAALTLPGVTPGQQGNYSVEISNPVGNANSRLASLEVPAAPAPPDTTPPTILSQPATLVVLPGGDATLAVAVTGAGPLSYQWIHDGTSVTGGTGPVLTLTSVGPADAGSYRVVVTSIFGAASSDAAQVILVGAPSIIDGPAPASVTSGQGATFMVGAAGGGLHYQWLRDGVSIPGATAASYTTPALTVGDDGALFSVLVYNGAGLVVSPSVRLTVHGINPPGMALFVGNFILGGGGGSADATGLDARLDTPEGLLADAAGNLYVAESNAAKVAKVVPAGVVTTIYQGVYSITSLAFGPDGSLYLGAPCGMPRLLPPLVAGAVNQPVQDGTCVVGQVRGITVDDAGSVLVSLPAGNAVYGWAAGGYAVYAGAPNVYVSPGTSDGSGTAARFNGQQGMVRAADGTLYVADTENHTIRKITPAGDVTTWIGAAGVPGLVDGRGAAARLYRPTQLSFDTSGNLYVLTQGDPAAPVAHVHRISPAGDVLTVFNATDEVLALATAAEAPWARQIRGLAVLGADRIALTAGNAVVLRTL